MRILGGTGRSRVSAVVAVVGMGIAGFSVAMLGAGAFFAGGSAPREGDIVVTVEEALNKQPTPLVTDPTAVVDTDAERVRFADFEKECMRAKGFDWRDAAFDPAPPGSALPGTVRWTDGQPPSVVAALNVALFGSTGQEGIYRWKEAGCHGYAVHMTGNDGNH